MVVLSEAARLRLESEENIWIASVRPDGRPHLTPVWFAWADERIYICIESQGVKGRNLVHNPRLSAALEDGTHPVICEGRAAALPQPWPESARQVFFKKYEWDIRTDQQNDLLVVITPLKWLAW